MFRDRKKTAEWNSYCKVSSFSFLAVFVSSSVREAGEQGDVEPRRIVRHPDSHQLFIGNLPHEVDKSELKDFFQSRLLSFFFYLFLRFSFNWKIIALHCCVGFCHTAM